MDDWSLNLVNSILIVGTTALGLAVVHLIARRILAGVRVLPLVRETRRQQLVTLVQATQWILVVTLVVSALLMLLSEFGIDITPLLASAGLAGLALSLGAQSLIKDLIGGLLIIVENQYAVGDSIVVGDVSGKVERITLRTTQVRAINGDLQIVPNGEVRVLANQTRDWARVVLDVGIAYEEDLDRALSILEEGAAAFAQDRTFKPDLLESPQVQGVHTLGDSAVMVRVIVKTQPGRQWAIGRALRKSLLAICEQEGVNLPYPRQEVWVRGETKVDDRAAEE
jgi:small conductance mechanosensitive channel